jgi:outer membrane protein assembly factor BamB
VTGIPVVDSGRVFFTSSDGALYAVSESSGGKAWSFAPSGGYSGYPWPVITQGNLYVGASNGKLYALGEGSGTVKWSFNAGAAVDPATVGQ